MANNACLFGSKYSDNKIKGKGKLVNYLKRIGACAFFKVCLLCKKLKNYRIIAITAAFGILASLTTGVLVFGSEMAQQEDIIVNEIRTAEIKLTETIENDSAVLEISNVSKGYIAVKYAGNNAKVKVTVSTNDIKNTYDILQYQYGEYVILPLHAGDGEYEVVVYEQLYDSEYLKMLSASFETKMDDELLPFLHPSSLVSFSPDSKAVSIADELGRVSDSDIEVVRRILRYIYRNISYDEMLREDVNETNNNYIPDIDKVLTDGKGICLDYSTLMVAMLRSQGIPAKVVVGDYILKDSDPLRHAWVRAFVQTGGEGWIDIDPTYGVSSLWRSDMKNPAAIYEFDYFY